MNDVMNYLSVVSILILISTIQIPLLVYIKVTVTFPSSNKCNLLICFGVSLDPHFFMCIYLTWFWQAILFVITI
jgi:hypothetical protein